jgi:hypothetical protein
MLAGIAVAVLLAAAAATGYVLATRPNPARHASLLPTRPVSVQSVGLVVVSPASSGPVSGQQLQLVNGSAAPEFSPLGAAQVAAGSPQWTADQMGGNSYIFIFLQTGECLTAGRGARPKLALEHCDLGLQQRWTRLSGAVIADGHDFYQYASSSDGKCLTLAGPLADGNSGTSLAPCAAGRPASQLIAFWWSSA